MDKAYILLNFDGLIQNEDIRFDIVYKEYGFKATAVVRPNAELKKKLEDAGWEISAYNNTVGEFPPHEEIFNMSEESLEKWCSYVKAEKDRLAKLGVYPMLWACRQNRFGPALEYALKKNGFKMARGGRSEFEHPFITGFSKDDFRTAPFEIYSHNIEEVKKNIDYAIEKKYALNIFTHKVVKTIEEDGGYDCIESTYREMMEYLKNKVEKGLCECVTYSEFYEMCKKEW